MNIEDREKVLLQDLFCRSEQCLRGLGYQKGTLGTYKATWNKLLTYSPDVFYDKAVCEKFLLQHFFIDVLNRTQQLDRQMRGALRHLNVLEEFQRVKIISRKYMRCHGEIHNESALSFSRAAERKAWQKRAQDDCALAAAPCWTRHHDQNTPTNSYT